MKKTAAAILAFLAWGSAQASEPGRFIVMDIGRSDTGFYQGHTEFDLYRLGVRRDFRRTFWTGEKARLGGYWEASANYWNGDGDDVFAAALSPVFVLSFGNGAGYRPYLEAGIGVALLSDHRIAGRELSTTFQFEDRIGFGLRGERFDIHYRFMHYSNGGIEKPNNGVDAHVVGFAVRF
jgi:lipid A 3-O-deacylase